MANLNLSHPLNVHGSLFVDTTCIDCGTCFHLAPEIFEESSDNHSYVKNQPETPHDWLFAKRALISCPTNSIGVNKAPPPFREALAQFPMLISENVYYCGYTSESSYGASSYLIERPDGNILIDSPRFHPTLVKELEALGGVRTMILTHQDDVADHESFREHFKLERIIHERDVRKTTAMVELKLKGEEILHFLPDLKIIPTPGHTQGHVVILYKNSFLFTGDHIFFDQSTGRPSASREVSWYSWDEQIKSTEKLLEFDFEWVLPGHGGWGFLQRQTMKTRMQDLIACMKK